MNVTLFSITFLLFLLAQSDLMFCKSNCTVKEQKCTEYTLAVTYQKKLYTSVTEKYIRAVILLGALFYSFVGISVICDKFMESIEVITSMERETQYRAPDGSIGIKREKVWNETIANLTLMALGSSAPEVLLAVIEICSRDFQAGDLGPGTILGSAAFNLFVICGICILVIPKGEIRRLENMNVFLFTAFSSIFAYIWLHSITVLISPGKIEVWEAFVTLIWFPVTVIVAYLLDINFMCKKANNYTNLASINSLAETNVLSYANHKFSSQEIETQSAFTISTAYKTPSESNKRTEELPHRRSKAFYKINASKFLKNSKMIFNRKTKDNRLISNIQFVEENVQYVRFNPRSYIVNENDGNVQVFMERGGFDLANGIEVGYYTKDGTALANKDFIPKKDVVRFRPFQRSTHILIKIINDDVFEMDESFTVHIDSVRTQKEPTENLELKIVRPKIATVFIIDDDHPGVFGFFLSEITISEDVGYVTITISRMHGARGEVSLPYRTEFGTAHGMGYDYIDQDGILFFDDNEKSMTIKIKIMNNQDYSKNKFFFVRLFDPYMDTDGSQPENPLDIEPELGFISRLKINITQSSKFQDALASLSYKATYHTNIPTTTLMDQIKDALSPIEEGDVTDEELEVLPSSLDYFVHFVPLFWKVLFAFVPPPKYLNGWCSFVSSISIIGLLTAWVADLATGFGCVLGLLDEVTSLTFVALGTSIPDTFASKLAAINEPSADASIGNVTGSNAVNVYLGLGVAWVIATLVSYSRGKTFQIHAESTSLTIILFCFFSTSAVCILIMRRHSSIGGELGGPTMTKCGSSLLLFAIYLTFIIICSLKSYCIVTIN